jgi:nicotinate-nucleotide--dimethylbenzimidazole phosphoribosyltransferase
MKVGGLEIAGMVGIMLEAAAQHTIIVIDGFIAGAAALVAYSLNPRVRGYMIAGHVSVEQGHRTQLAHMGLAPLLNLDLRLGEGTGAVLAIPIIESALRAHDEMLTFAEAGVSEQLEEEEK